MGATAKGVSREPRGPNGPWEPPDSHFLRSLRPIVGRDTHT